MLPSCKAETAAPPGSHTPDIAFSQPRTQRSPSPTPGGCCLGSPGPPRAPAPATRGTGGSHTSCRWPQLFPSELLIPSTRRHWHFSPVRRQAAHTDAVTGSGRRRQRHPRPLVPGSYPRRSVPCPEHVAGLEQRWGGFGDSNLSSNLFLLLAASGASREVLCGTLQHRGRWDISLGSRAIPWGAR